MNKNLIMVVIGIVVVVLALYLYNENKSSDAERELNQAGESIGGMMDDAADNVNSAINT